ncbi:MAG: cytochrome c oxidase assembly protein, partial [Mycobacterium sp.]
MQTRPEPASRRGTLVSLAVGCIAAAAGLACYALAAGGRAYAIRGDSFPGNVTSVAEIVGYFVATLAGGLCFGGLLYVVVTARPDARGVIDDRAFRTHLLVERSSAVWALSAMVMVVVQAASSAGLSVTRLLGSAAISDAMLASEMSRAWIAVTAAAVVVAVGSRLSVRWVAQFLLLVPALIGVVALPVSGNAGQGPDHDYATSTAIVFAVALAALTGVTAAAAVNPPAERLARRVLVVKTLCGVVALGYGVVLLSTLTDPGDLVATAYGRAGVAAGVLLALVWLAGLASVGDSRVRDAVGALAVIGVIALTASMATQIAPRLFAHRLTMWDILLGYVLPGPPSVSRILTVWRFDTFIGVGAVVLAVAYTLGFLRLRRRGDGWPVGRLVAWLAGCLAMLVTSSSG